MAIEKGAYWDCIDEVLILSLRFSIMAESNLNTYQLVNHKFAVLYFALIIIILMSRLIRIFIVIC